MPNSKKRLSLLAVAALGALLLLPASGQAAQVFGSDLLEEPNQPDCFELLSCTVVANVENPAEGQLTSAGSPIDGVITGFRVRAAVDAPTQVTLRVASVTPEGQPAISATATITATGTPVTLQPTSAAEEPAFRVQAFPARVAVRKGQHLALDWIASPGAGLVVTHDASGDKFSYGFSPPLSDGMARQSTEALGQLLVQATVEPDLDGDGFGDETQDRCPSQRTTAGACDVTPPVVTKLKVAHGKATYTLSEAATVNLQLLKKSRKGKFRKLGKAFAGPGNAGPNRVKLPKAAGRGGIYRLQMTAVDVAGNQASRAKAFRVRTRSGIIIG